MKLSKKLNAALILVLVCLALVITASYAWLTMSTRPEINSIDTNIGANGSLEIALLTEQTFADPLQIRTAIGDSAVAQDVLESNTSWGNVIELNDERYGLSHITLHPARLNIENNGGELALGKNMLKTADFGIDGRIKILSEKTVSTVMSDNAFTYYADRQLYGVRAIGTVSNLTSQQTALAAARSSVKAHTAAAVRTAKHAWRDYGAGIVDILYSHYAVGDSDFAAENVIAVREMANGMAEAVDYLDAAMRQGIIGVLASQIADEPSFDALCARVSNTAVPLSDIVNILGGNAVAEFAAWAQKVDQMKADVQAVAVGSYALANGGSWEQLEPLLDALLDAKKVYLGDKLLSDPTSFEAMTADNVLLLATDSGVMAAIAEYAGNYSAFTMWTDTISVEARTAASNEQSYLFRVEQLLENCKAAAGNWTRANMDDLYGFAVDLAFRCNEPSGLLLQTVPEMRVENESEIPAIQGGGSYMRFASTNMETDQLLKLMDTIRIGFISDRNTLLGVAKLNLTNYEEQEEGVFAPLYLYEHTLEEDGSISVGERRRDDAAILELSRNAPTIVSVVVWLDGDCVDNSMVSDVVQQSMNGVLNLQFSSSVDLIPSKETVKN